MRLYVCTVLLTVFMLTGASISAAQPAQTIPATAGGDEDMEVLLSTMNEVLEENRKMREQMQSNEDSLKKMARENELLRSQVRRMKNLQEELGSKDKERAETLAKNVEALEAQLTSLEAENKKLSEERAYHAEQIPMLESEAERLKRLLDTAILEEERVDYLNLIDNAQEMAERSFEELRTTKKKAEVLNRDFGDAYYKLGNMLFDMKDFDNAIVSYRKALEANPVDAWVHHNLGIIYDYYIHDDTKALFHYQQYLQYQPLGDQANKIRERVLDMELKKNIVPQEPLRKDFFESYSKRPR